MKINISSVVPLGIVFAGITTLNQAIAAPSPWSIGVGGGVSSELYKDTHSDSNATLLGGYDGEHIYLKGTELGYRLFAKDAKQNVMLRVLYDGRHFDPSDSDDQQMKQLDKRHGTGLIGPKMQIKTAAGTFESGVAVEFTGEHQGYLATVGWSYPLIMGNMGIIPNLGYEHNSEKMANYLYGVSDHEARHSGIQRYHVNGAGQYYMGVNGFFKLTEHIRFDSGLRFTHYDSEIKDSPIVAHGNNAALFVAASYVF
ncbi:hypothetical protein F9817_06235 [Vibrio sp. CAIM 722]|uniref:MipA/OmpV family protein n=1 Tax=Vibrio eleionomae TaxID=2653505 RepID=A0A7X4LIX4_9VIBR|nr:MipA/OmpV family protein [Vibrio eleionomae]MZI92790.1 hypothetical protein [Vibrio eleionomae]